MIVHEIPINVMSFEIAMHSTIAVWLHDSLKNGIIFLGSSRDPIAIKSRVKLESE